MILQALVSHYEDLARRSESDSAFVVPHFGWSRVSVSACIVLDESGNLTDIISFVEGKKITRFMEVPLQLKRSGRTPPPYFLCDNASHMLGIEKGEVTDHSIAYFDAFRTSNTKILSEMPCPEAQAIYSFLETWNPKEQFSDPIVQTAIKQGIEKGNLVFRINSVWALDVPEIHQGWDTYYRNSLQSDVIGTCLVTGKQDSIARIHNSVKGIYADSISPNGWSLVSFDKDAFCSYGKSQCYNAPVGQYAAFAYTTALNHLLADRERVCHIGDTTVVCWAKGGQTAYPDFMNCCAFGSPSPLSDEDLHALVKALCQGQKVEFEETKLDPDNEFYILGLSPNAARLSVRFFLHSSFGNFLKNVEAHHERMRIVRPAYDKFETLSVWKMLDETVNQNSRNKVAAPHLAGETLRSILNDAPYPAQLLQGVRLRIRAEQTITRGRAAILKAYYTKNPNYQIPKEVLTVSLNPESTNVPYTLGRLFSVLEAIQSSASPGINTTIKDRYFNSASATPSHVFPMLVNLAQKHMKKMDGGMSTYYDKQLTELMSKLDDYPAHLSIPQQGAFQLGYYHQTQARYTSKKDKEEN